MRMRQRCVRRATSSGGASTFAATLALCLLGLSACGGSTSPKPRTSARAAVAICRRAAGTLVALADHVAAARVSSAAQTGNNGAPQCRLVAPGMRVVVNADSSPQPYARLERAIVEAGQQFGTKRTFTPPRTVPHLGLDASWLPDLDELLTSDGHILLSVTVYAPTTTDADRRDLATALARTYLGAPDAALARGPAPSG